MDSKEATLPLLDRTSCSTNKTAEAGSKSSSVDKLETENSTPIMVTESDLDFQSAYDAFRSAQDDNQRNNIFEVEFYKLFTERKIKLTRDIYEWYNNYTKEQIQEKAREESYKQNKYMKPIKISDNIEDQIVMNDDDDNWTIYRNRAEFEKHLEFMIQEKKRLEQEKRISERGRTDNDSDEFIDETNLGEMDLFTIEKGILAIACSTIVHARSTRGGQILAEVNKASHARSLCHAKTFPNIPVVIKPHKYLNSKKGVIRTSLLKKLPVSEIK